MALTPLKLRPGINRTDTEYDSTGRWVDCDNIRFMNGMPEKIGGWTTLLSTKFAGICRGMFQWRDNAEYRRLAVGTSKKVYRVDGGTMTNITPFTTVATTTLGANPFATVSGSYTITVTHNAHGQVAGDNIVFDGAAAVGGVTIEGTYVIDSVTDANTYVMTYQGDTAPTFTGSGGGSAVTVKTFRGSLANPFDTTASSATVTVNHSAHGRTVGDTVNFSGGSAVGGITISGEYTVVTVPTGSTYTITHSAAASSTVTGGGGSPTYRYEVSIGLDTTIAASGYGVGTYGSGTYGSPRTVSVTLHARTWSLDNFGEVLIFNFRGGDLYEWIPNINVRGTPITQSPTEVQASFVTEERHVVTLGSGGNKLKDSNSDLADRYVWVPTDTNEARSGVISGGNELISARRLRGNRAIVWTDQAAFVRQYTFDDYIRSYTRVGGRCGLIGPLAAVEMAGVAYWMSPDNFFSFDGNTLRPLGTDDIRDYVFTDINRTQRFKFHAWPYQQQGEVWFFYCSANATEIDRCVAFGIDETASAGAPVWWLNNTIIRTSAVDRELFDYPIMAGTDGYLYSHEYGLNANGSALDAWVRSAAFDLENGDRSLEVDQIIPDFKRIVGNVDMTLYTRDEPLNSETTNGPYTLTSTSGQVDLDPRVSGGQVAFKIRSNAVDGDFRLGRLRANSMPGGSRR